MRVKCLTVAVAVLVAVGVWQVRAAQGPGAKPQTGPDAAGLKHGTYLVNAAILCGDCHTPQDDKGKPDKAQHLRGSTLPIRPKKETKDWADEAPDITSRGLAGMWSEQALVKFLMTGTDPDGKTARPPMPAFRLNPEDARAVALYLRSLPGSKGRGAGEKAGKNPE
jgi:mono/diheme cytochrome c family protein